MSVLYFMVFINGLFVGISFCQGEFYFKLYWFVIYEVFKQTILKILNL